MASDEQLVEQVANGSETALAELLRRYERSLSSFIYRHTGGQDVEDVYQETWFRVVRQARRFDPTLRFSTWLFQIAINLCRDRYRRQRPLPERDSVTSADDADLAGIDARLDANALLAQLPDVQREVLILRYFHDLSEQQIAAIVGCPVGTVKSRMHTALNRLAELTAGDRR